MNLGIARSHMTVLHPVGLCFRELNWNQAVENGWVRERDFYSCWIVIAGGWEAFKAQGIRQ